MRIPANSSVSSDLILIAQAVMAQELINSFLTKLKIVILQRIGINQASKNSLSQDIAQSMSSCVPYNQVRYQLPQSSVPPQQVRSMHHLIQNMRPGYTLLNSSPLEWECCKLYDTLCFKMFIRFFFWSCNAPQGDYGFIKTLKPHVLP